jgi:hypothetical protein
LMQMAVIELIRADAKGDSPNRVSFSSADCQHARCRHSSWVTLYRHGGLGLFSACSTLQAVLSNMKPLPA